MSARELTRCAVMTALLIAVQYVLSFVSGVELVTAVFAAFCYTSGFKQGALTGAAFSLLRCLIYGFLPNVIFLYLIYYTAFAAVFGFIGRRRFSIAVFEFICIAIAMISAVCVFIKIPISLIYRPRLRVMFILVAILFTVFAVLGYLFRDKDLNQENGSENSNKQNKEAEERNAEKNDLNDPEFDEKCEKSRGEKYSEVLFASAAAAVMTVFFTLLDDVITPLFLGYSAAAAAAYFYAGLVTMLTQTFCAAVSVALLFRPLTRVLKAGKGSSRV